MRYKKGQELFGRTGWREQAIPIGPVHSMIFEAQSGRRPFRGPFAVLKKEAILSMIEYDMNLKPNALGNLGTKCSVEMHRCGNSTGCMDCQSELQCSTTLETKCQFHTT